MIENVQYIERKGRKEYAIVPISLWKHITEDAEMLEDIRAYDEFKANDDGIRIPAAVLDAELDGAHPVKAWREHRGLNLDSLAKKAGISKPYLHQIETGKRKGTVKTLRAIANALDVPMDALHCSR